MAKAKASADTDDIALVVFGRDDNGKAHASRFDAASAELAEKAAGLMGMHAMRVDSDEGRAAALALPLGRVFGSGRAFVPFVKAAVYERLKALAGVSAESEPSAPKRRRAVAAAVGDEPGVTEPGEASGETALDADPPSLPADFRAIGPGSLVLAPENDKSSWYPAIVVRAKDDHRWVLKWRDYDDWPTFVRKRDDIGLINPAMAIG